MFNKFIKVAKPQVGEEEVAAVREVLLSGNYTSGDKVKEFERRFAKYIGVKYAVAVSSGTAALHIALESMGVLNGDEVIVPPLTFFATVSAVLYVGAVPVFADIDLNNLCLSPYDVERKITSKTKAIIPVHLFGAAADMGQILDIADRHHIQVLEDCAQAHGTERKGRRVGGIGTAGAFSFFATKHMTTGEGGMITTNNYEIATASRCIRSHGIIGRDDHVRLGFNNRMTEIAAAMGLVQLAKLNILNKKRIENSKFILSEVDTLDWSKVPVVHDGSKHTYFWCPIMVRPESGRTIDDLKLHLRRNGIGFRQRYSEPLYMQPVLRNIGLDYRMVAKVKRVDLPNVNKVAGNVIGLPNHPGLTKQELVRIVMVLKSF